MTFGSGLKLGSRALLALAAAAVLASAPAAAQDASKMVNYPAEKFAIAPGGVDMRTGRFVYSETDLSIGGEGGALTLTRTMPDRVANHANPFGNFSHNWDIFLLETRTDLTTGAWVGSDYRMNVHHSGRSFTFESFASHQGFTYKSDGPPALLTFSGSDKSSGSTIYTYSEPDGTVLTFRPIGSGDCADQIWGSAPRRCAFVSEMAEPDGTRYWFQYAATGGGNGARLARVTSSRGYALLLEGSGSLVTRACVLNLALAAAPADGICPVGSTHVTSYGYADGRLTSATDAVNATSSFTYAPAGNTLAMGFVKPGQTAPWLTNYVTIVRDEEDAPQEVVLSQAFAGGQGYGYSYDSPPATTNRPVPTIAGGRYTDAEGRVTFVTYGFPLMPGSGPTTHCPNPPCTLDGDDAFMGWVYQQTPGPVEIVDPLGRKTAMDYCDPNKLAVPPPYGGCDVFPLQSFVDPEGARTVLEYDSYRNVRKVTRHPRPGILGPDGLTPQPIVVSAAYDIANPKSATKPLWMKDGNGNTTSWTYAPEHGGVLTETGAAVNGVSPQKRHSYVQRSARLADGSPAGPPVWLLARTAFCRTGNPNPGGTGCALGAGDEVVTDYDYGPDSGPTNLLLRGQATTADGTTHRSCYGYDAVGRRIAEATPGAGLASCPATVSAGAGTWFVASTRYDAEGRVTGTIAPEADNSGRRIAVRNSYDPAGRLVKVEQGWLAAWQSESVAPSAWTGFTIVKIVDNEYDALDRKTREVVSGPGTAALSVIDYGYDLANRPTCTAVRMNPATWFTQLADKCVPGPPHPVNGYDRITRNVYDAAGQPIESWDGVGTPLERREAGWTYNLNGEKTSLTDARLYRSEMTRDAFGRQSRWIFPSKTATLTADANDYEEYRYDPAGNRTHLRKRDGSVLTYQYDALNRMTVKIVPERAGLTAAQTRDVHYAYDNRNLQTRARFDGLEGEGVTTQYDGFGRVSSSTLAMAGTSRTLSSLYNVENNRTRLTHPDGALFPYVHDGLGRLAMLLDRASVQTVDDYVIRYIYKPEGPVHVAVRGAGNVGFTTVFYYDAMGRPVAIYNDLPTPGNDVNIGLGYNLAGQIASSGRDNDSYAWDGAFAAVRDYSVNGQNQYNAVTSGGATVGAFTYDANGNLLSETTQAHGARTYTWDVENRLVGLSGAASASLVYDPLGRLFQVSAGAAVTQFLFDGDDLVAEYNGSGALTKRYVHGPGTDDPVAVYEGPALGVAGRRYTLPDERGSIIGLINADGSPSVYNRYDEYGLRGQNNGGRFQFTGQIWIDELGLYYYKARVYSPALGRFLQVDPIGYEDQINLYTYVGNDPVNGTDPTGEDCRNPDGTRCSNSTATTATAATTVAAREGVGAQRARAQYNRSIAPLAPDDEAGRSAAKASARAATPRITRGVIEGIRPGLGPKPGSGGTANRANPAADRLAARLGTAGRVAGVAGVAVGVARVATSDDPAREAARVGGGITGAIAGAQTGATVGAVAGPWGAAAGGVIGGIAGGFFGEKLVDRVLDW